MNGFTLFGKELLQIVKNKKILIPIIAILTIPLIYSGMFLWTFQDPYAKMDQLPVAIVNTDEGATMNGEALNVGENLVDNLKEMDDGFQFHFVSEQEAAEGLDELKYYMVIKIPQDFSKNATTLLEDHPQKMRLEYMPNDSYNFIASQLGETAVDRIKASIQTEVSKTYAETMFTTAMEMSNGFEKASDGAAKLNDGAIQLENGVDEIKDNLELLASKSVEFQSGAETAKSGTNELAKGSSELADGMDQLSDAGGQLLEASKTVKNGVGSLADGISSANDGLSEMNEKMPLLVDGTGQVIDGLHQFQAELPKQLADKLAEQLAGGSEGMTAGIDQLHQGITDGLSKELAPQLTDGLTQSIANEMANTMIASQNAQMEQLRKTLLSEVGEEKTYEIMQSLLAEASTKEQLQHSIAAALQPKIAAGINAGINNTILDIDNGFSSYQQQVSEQLTASGIETQIAKAVEPTFKKLTDGLESLYDNQLALQNGVNNLESGTAQLRDGTFALKDGQTNFVTNFDLFTQKIADADQGANQLSAGSSQLNNGMDQLTDASAQLSNGASQLAEGAKQLSDGTNDLQNGTDELASNLNDAAGKAGSLNPDDDTYDMMASPIESDVMHMHEVPNYGTGFAPYFISLGLFVGALLLTIIYPLVESAGIPKNGFSWFFSKFAVMAAVGIIQAILTGLVVLYGLDIHAQSVPLFFLFAIITSLTFIALIQFLVTVANNPGRFVAIIILILQLTSSAGTFPLEVIPKAVQWFNPLLPMTYSVSGFKAVISSGDYSFMWQNAGILAGYIIVFVVLTIAYFVWKYRKQYKANELIGEQGAA